MPLGVPGLDEFWRGVLLPRLGVGSRELEPFALEKLPLEPSEVCEGRRTAAPFCAFWDW